MPRATPLLVVALAVCSLPGCRKATKFVAEIQLPEPDQPIARGAPPPPPDAGPTADVVAPKPADKPKPTPKSPEDKAKEARRLAKEARRKKREAARARARRVVPLEEITLTREQIRGTPPRADFPLLAVFARIRQLASVGEVRYLMPWLTRTSRARIAHHHRGVKVVPIAPRTLWQRLRGKVTSVAYDGKRGILTLERRGDVRKLTFFVEGGTWRLDLDTGATGPAPKPPQLSLREATRGITGQGPLVAVFQTTAGRFRCKLHEGRAPDTVAHFVGLARGLIGPVHTGGRIRHFYDGLRIHAAVPGKLIQGGDPTETGTGGAGVTVRDEFDPKLRHDRAGVLALATAGPHTGSSQFYVTLAPAPKLDDRHSVFGLCRDLDVVRKIAELAPRTVVIEKVVIQRDY